MPEETATIPEETIDPTNSDPEPESDLHSAVSNASGIATETVENVAAISPDLAGEWLNALSHSTAQAIITSSDLPQPSKDRLLSQTYTSPEEVTTAIDSERRYLAQLSQDSIIQIVDSPPRSPHISGLRSSVDQLSLALDPAAWVELTLRNEFFDRQERATMLRRSLLSLQTEYAENLKLKEEYKDKYHQWETLGLNFTLLITSD